MTGAAPAVVAGGAGGIGAAVARRLASEAWVAEVIVADRSLEDAASVAGEIDAGPGAGARAVAVDVTDAESLRDLWDASPGVRHVASCVGVFHAGEDDPAAFRRLLEVNLIGPYALARQYADRMAAAEGGSIVSVGSIAARVPRLHQAAYAASKSGLEQALRVLGLELAARGVRVNTVTPGPTDTGMRQRFLQSGTDIDLAAGDLATYRAGIPNGRIATAEQIAEVVAFLLSPAADHVTLQDLVVDGGQLLGA